MNKNKKSILIWLGIFFTLFFAVSFIQNNYFDTSKIDLAFSDFLNQVNDKQISSVKLQGRNIEGTFVNGSSFYTYGIEYPFLLDHLMKNGVHVEILPPDTKMHSILSILISWTPMFLLIGVWLFFMKQMQGGGKGLGFGRSRAKLMSEKSPKVTFKDVAGIDEAKEELTELVDFLRDPSKFQKLGGKIPKGCLLIGPPGTGKTLLAKAIAGEAHVPFFSISGSDFVEMFVGVGASRVRDMFEQGKRKAPCIIFIDEIDAVGRHRGVGLGGGNDEREQTLNQILVEMDGFEANEGVIIIAATNRPDVLDKALLRPGRFDRRIVINNPDIDGRENILKVHLKKIKYSNKVDCRVIARSTPGFSGAELENLVNEAALLAARKNRKEVLTEDFEESKDKVLMGVARKSMVMSDEEKMLTAYHEAGHAIVSYHLPASDPIHKATIIPRGMALGMVMRLPEKDRVSVRKEKLEADVAVAMGGRIAEQLIFGNDKITTGASNDIEVATKMARSMVMAWGMSEKVGPIFYLNDNDDMYNLSGKSHSSKSEYTSQIIDQEVHKVIQAGYDCAKNILTNHINQLELLAKTLIEKETLSGHQINNLLSGRPLDAEGDITTANMVIDDDKNS